MYNQMVVHELTRDETDLLFHALADGTRRDIVSRVIEREQSVSTLAERYSVSFAAVQKHIAVLERAALVTKQRRGREQIVSSNVHTIRKARDVLRSWEELWQQRANRIEEILAADDPRESPHKRDSPDTETTTTPEGNAS
jgi:DNA-binding transcriptional ArsR family regulator